MNGNKITILIVIYIVTLLILYPALAYVAMYEMNILREKLPHGPVAYYIQIFLTGPVSILSGLILIFRFGYRTREKFFGWVFLIIGLVWLGFIFKATLEGGAAL